MARPFKRPARLRDAACEKPHTNTSSDILWWCLMKTLSTLMGLTLALAACDSDSEAKKVTVSGMAYVKNSPNPVVGGTVSIAEQPSLTTTTDDDGRWTLEVEEGSTVTPFIAAEGFVTTHTQTFEADADIADVHFQMIPPTLFMLLADAIGIEPDPTKCQISTEVTDLMAQDLTVAQLVAERPHGVEGATIDITPPAGPITFFEYGDPFDQPNGELTATTTSGGLVSTQVDPGVYTITASHPSRTFSSITVTCAAGRFVNATAPHGLHETSN